MLKLSGEIHSWCLCMLLIYIMWICCYLWTAELSEICLHWMILGVKLLQLLARCYLQVVCLLAVVRHRRPLCRRLLSTLHHRKLLFLLPQLVLLWLNSLLCRQLMPIRSLAPRRLSVALQSPQSQQVLRRNMLYQRQQMLLVRSLHPRKRVQQISSHVEYAFRPSQTFQRMHESGDKLIFLVIKYSSLWWYNDISMLFRRKCWTLAYLLNLTAAWTRFHMFLKKISWSLMI